LPGGGFPAEVQLRTADIYADTAEAREEVARGIRTQDLVLSARLDKGACVRGCVIVFLRETAWLECAGQKAEGWTITPHPHIICGAFGGLN